jgi:hypothetical protein
MRLDGPKSGLDYMYMFAITGREKGFSLLHSVQTGSDVHQTFYPMGNRCSFPKDKVTSALN